MYCSARAKMVRVRTKRESWKLMDTNKNYKLKIITWHVLPE
jgi:hypothetical protein